jgi:hypothetical protein
MKKAFFRDSLNVWLQFLRHGHKELALHRCQWKHQPPLRLQQTLKQMRHGTKMKNRDMARIVPVPGPTMRNGRREYPKMPLL